ncbi:MAG: hypothetical protein EBR82_66760 [Caulobacteraceae bacterium]|nr:hypothetical protein [Caulobacteraceae bacterium]
MLLKADLPLKADLLLKRVFCKKNTYKFLTKYVRGFSGCWLLANACASVRANQATRASKRKGKQGQASKGKQGKPRGKARGKGWHGDIEKPHPLPGGACYGKGLFY